MTTHEQKLIYESLNEVTLGRDYVFSIIKKNESYGWCVAIDNLKEPDWPHIYKRNGFCSENSALEDVQYFLKKIGVTK